MLVKITRYVCLLGCGMLEGIAATVLVLELVLRGLNRPGVCPRPAGGVRLLYAVHRRRPAIDARSHGDAGHPGPQVA